MHFFPFRCLGCQPQTNREDSSTTAAMSSVANAGDTAAGSGSTGSTAAAVISAIARPHDDTAPRERFLDVQQQNTGLNPASAEHRNNKSPRMMSPNEPANSPAPTGKPLPCVLPTDCYALEKWCEW